jgi:hypothetical protein
LIEPMIELSRKPDAETSFVHLQPSHIGTGELPKRVEIAGPRLGIDAFMNLARCIDRLEKNC